jgi:glycosyltransferase involved in cell wall biosynthesis
MRIAYLVNQYPATSHTFIRREIRALERRGVEVLRLSLRAAKSGLVGPEDLEEAAKTRVIVGAPVGTLVKAMFASFAVAPMACAGAFVLMLRFAWRSETGLIRHFFYYAEALVVATWLREEKAAHLHAHFGTNSATVALLAARIADVGFSMTVHGPEEFDKPDLIGLPAKIRKCSFAAAVSQFGASQLRRLVPPEYWERIKVVRCGVEREFAGGVPPPPPAEPRFVSVGRLAAQKGHITLMEAVGKLGREGRACEVELIGEGELRRTLEAAAAQFGVAGRVRFSGWRAPAEVRAAIEKARALALPSYAEGLPVTIMEAFALERPVIATYVAGVPELVAPGENGWLVPAGDADALAAAMAAALAAPPEQLAAMGRAGKKRVEEAHDIDKIAAELERLFGEAARRKEAR